MKTWRYDERTGMVAVYAGEELNCLDLPSDCFIYVRYWKQKEGALGFEVVEEDKKIGRLVAAAPELLEALKDAVAIIYARGGSTKGTSIDAAIAKAEGVGGGLTHA